MKNVIYLLLINCLSVFFLIHLFTGELSIMHVSRYKNELYVINLEYQKLVQYNQSLNQQIKYLHNPINIDYLQTIAMNQYNRIPMRYKIYKLKQISIDNE